MYKRNHYSKSCNHNFFLFLLMALMGFCYLISPVVVAETGSSISFPKSLKGKKVYAGKNGLRLIVDTTWTGTNGYRPIKVTVESAKPSATDVLIDFKFTATQFSRTRKSITTKKSLTLPIGSWKHDTWIYVPQLHVWDYVSWDVWVDGVQWIDGRSIGNRTVDGMKFDIQPSDLSVLVFGDKPTYIEIEKTLKDFPNLSIDFFSCNQENFPAKFLAFSGLDLVTFKADNLLEFSRSNPDLIKVLMRWVHAGGNLWLFDAGVKYSKLNKINQEVFGLDKNTTELQLGDWRYLPFSENKRSAADALIDLKSAFSIPKDALEKDLDWNVFTPSDSRDSFIARSLGFGAIVAFQSSSNSLDIQSISQIESTAISNRMEAIERFGNNPKSTNRQFSNWLIPDVGTAPVFEFQLLISIFVILIGPVNYWLLKRGNHLPLLLVTVPVSALLTTVLLFVYGIASDGLSVRLRARSFTILDQGTGQASSWARLSYYAGIAPKEGLIFPDNSAVFPILAPRSQSGFSRRGRIEREMHWDEEQHLNRGWLNSRTPTQYLTITNQSLEYNLDFISEEKGISVKNNLGTKLLFLGVKDRQGGFYVGRGLALDTVSKLQPTNLKSIQKQLRDILLDNPLEFPIGFVQQRRSIRDAFSGSTLSSNLLESHLEILISPIADTWNRGSYLAVTDTGIFIPFGLDELKECNSLHVIQGKW